MDSQSDLGRERLWTYSRVMMLTASFDGTILAANPEWTSLLGWGPEQLVGRNFFDFIHPDDVARTQAEAGSLAGGEQTPKFENRYRKKDGAYLDIDWTAVSDGELIHAIGRDVTAEKLHAKALRVAEEGRRHSQKMEAIGQLTGGVAHDFNNLLTVIRASADLLRRGHLDAERQARYIDAIADTADRAARLTGQLLAFARKQNLEPEVFSLSRSLEGLAQIVRTLAGPRIEVVVHLEGEECFIEADAGQFETAIINLAVNARDAMDGHGRLEIRVRAVDCLPPLRGHPAAEGSCVGVSISDTGSGIAAANIDSIFEPFFTTKEVGKGTGLGLSQVYGFAKQSGGDVGVDSEQGVGTSITLYFPSRDGPGAPVAVASSPRPRMRSGKRILVVEDNRDVGAFSTQLLAELGYATVWVANGPAALDRIAADANFDLVLTDVVMPGMSGVELAQHLRASRPDLPVILTSGYSHVIAAEGTHGFALLRKPYSLDALSAVLEDAIGRP